MTDMTEWKDIEDFLPEEGKLIIIKTKTNNEEGCGCCKYEIGILKNDTITTSTDNYSLKKIFDEEYWVNENFVKETLNFKNIILWAYVPKEEQ